MISKVLIPLLAGAGVLFAVYTVLASQKEPPPANPMAMPSESPYGHTVAGAGIIEASTENIAVGTPVPGLVMEVFVKVGDRVKAGAPLFRLDDRDLRAELEVRKASAKSAEARVQTDSESLADVKNQFEMWKTVQDVRAVSKDELDRRKFAVAIQAAKLEQAKADVISSSAQTQAAQTEIDRRLVRAPVDGQILQVKIRVGEFAPAGMLQQPLMLLGNTDVLHVRCDIDENDAWRVSPDAPAVATVRGNRDLKTGLKFVRVEPFVVPKHSLTGDSTERVD
ncbi:MAG TPA: HlyD family efflux transporter periplasmic adaptor subunit, partial [Tepidisphaeraceae bacterium]